MRLTVADLALAIGKDENYVRQHIRRKNLTAEKDGGRVLVEEAEAVRWAKERGLPLTQAIITPESDGEVSTRAARMTVLAVRAPNGTATNMFTLVRHRDHKSLGPWTKIENPDWHRETSNAEDSGQADNLILYRLDTTLAKCQEIVKQILQSGVLDIDSSEIRYALEQRPRHHWTYQDHTASHQEVFGHLFRRHSAEITEYWCFDSETQARWMGTLESAEAASRAMAKVLHFPLDQRPDRAGNLMIASAQDAIESEITGRPGKNLILRVAGNNWTTPPPGAYSASVWAYHSDDTVAQCSMEIRDPETVISRDTDFDRLGYAIYRNSDGQCIDQYDAYLVKSIAMSTVVAGPEVRMNIKANGNSIEVGTSLGTSRETRTIENSNGDQMDQAVRTKYLSYRAWERDQSARKEGSLVRFVPEQVEEAVAYITNLIGQENSSEGPIYFADPHFLGEKPGNTEIKLLTAILAESRGRPLNILLGRHWKEGRTLGYPKPLVANATVRSFTRAGEREGPAFHDRYLITPAGETLITNSVNGWGSHGVTFNRLSHGVYRAEAEYLWSLTTGAEGNGVLAEGVEPW